LWAAPVPKNRRASRTLRRALATHVDPGGSSWPAPDRQRRRDLRPPRRAWQFARALTNLHGKETLTNALDSRKEKCRQRVNFLRISV